ncbi:hypothetical protein [Nocardioides panzhihuensis]|uniref:Plasmid mobilization relaxosome protein MobC n=1 Tax=Nocardioides panzhihuensis TaxID=860243 RepID=A0A7Z0DT11_9ACTN|nr:hypothetical protein [Nocardioides panzhihuensis]NYI81235.1 hypothetical protein [Nocardioides panzhihuensis]
MHRRERVPGGRPVQVLVRLTEAEAGEIGRRADAAGLTAASYLAVVGMAEEAPDMAPRAGGAGAVSGGRGVSMAVSLEWRNAAAAELLAVVRQARGVARNLNQLTHYTHSERHLHAETEQVLAETLQLIRRAVQVANLLDPRRPKDEHTDPVEESPAAAPERAGE